jgi:murein DD-endopeptidase MepM/ murein hydrolase activator NlpD
VAAAVVASEESVLRSPLLPLTTISTQEEEAAPLPAPTPTPEASLFAASVLPEVVTPEPMKPAFFVYTVQEGDTVGGVAARFGISSTSILWNNHDLESADELSVGQQLRVPSSDGIVYEVRLGDTLSDVAGYFGVEVDEILAFPANNLGSVDDIVENQTLFIPNGTRPTPAEPAPVETEVDDPASDAEPADLPPPSSGPSSAAGFIWPASGPVSSYFGPSHPLGIDIDQFNSPGAPIYAAASGTVTFAGGTTCCSYGLYIVINHGNGLETLYAHLGSFTVSQGQYVEQGQVIGYVGLTGYTTGYHLHFEVHLNGQVVDPLGYLP